MLARADHGAIQYERVQWLLFPERQRHGAARGQVSAQRALNARHTRQASHSGQVPHWHAGRQCSVRRAGHVRRADVAELASAGGSLDENANGRAGGCAIDAQHMRHNGQTVGTQKDRGAQDSVQRAVATPG